jgi:hypothetical protein
MKIKSIFLSSVITASLLFSFAQAESYMYKWKNANGEVQYTERPPAPGVKFQRIKVKNPSSGESPNYAKTEKTEGQDQEKPEGEAYGGWKKDNCDRANKNLDILQNAGRISQDDGQGGKRLMSDEERQAQIVQMKALKDKYCSDKK